MTSLQYEELFRLARNEYALLTATSQAVLQFLSVLFEPVNRTNLAKYLRGSGIRGDDGKPLSTKALADILDPMVKLNLVIRTTMGTTDYYACSRNIAFHATRAAMDSGRFSAMAEVVRNEIPVYSYGFSKRIVRFDVCLRELRLALFSHDEKQVGTLFQACHEQFPEKMTRQSLFSILCASPFDGVWFRNLPVAIQAVAVEEMVVHRLEHFEDIADLLSLLQERLRKPDDAHNTLFRKLACSIMLFRGDLVQTQVILDSTEEIDGRDSLWGWLHFLRGENESAIQAYERRLRTVRKMNDKRQIVLGMLSGIFYLLALLKSNDARNRTRVAEFMDMIHKKPIVSINPAYGCFSALFLAQQNRMEEANILVSETATDERACCFGRLFKAVGRFWVDPEFARRQGAGVPVLFEQARANGYQWAAMELAGLMAAMDPNALDHAEYAARVQRETGMHRLLPIVAREESWERALKALIDMGAVGTGKTTTNSNTERRLAWMINLFGNIVMNIQPLEQIRSAKGVWSKGRPIPLKRLVRNTGKLDFLTAQDRKISSAITGYSNYYNGVHYEFIWQKAILAMVGHPLVFLEDHPDTNIEIVKAEPELLVEQKGGQVSIRFAEVAENEGVIVIQETPTRCKVVEVTAAHRKIAQILGPKGLRVPSTVNNQVMQAMQAISPLVTIHSGIGGSVANINEVPSDSTPHIHLMPYDDGLRVKLLVRPFSGEGPYFQPGKGGNVLIAEVNGTRMQTQRNLKDELTRANTVMTKCSALFPGEDCTDWILGDPESCLELLLELKTVSDQAVVAWPEGEKLRVSQPVAMDGMRVRIQRDQDWFSLTGELTLDEGLVMDMAQLLDLARDRDSRFIPLGEGRFLALTELFRRQLAEINDFSEKGAKGRRFHPLAGQIFQELLADVEKIDADNHWKAHLKKLDRALNVDPEIPSTLQAALRDYQVSGFRWLARLAARGVGACLADDMGLGKTLQALTLLLYRAREGPSLVVAPTSVGSNWLAEISRFAPTLNGILFGQAPRQPTLNALQPFDVVVCSYGLLQMEAEMLAAVRWNVIVLDEAQAIKNRLTKRSQAAMALNGSFRLLTTGTPMENHLGELWNLFQFINPGLLGRLEVFNERFAAPIERQGDKNAQKRLRKLIQPFLLRRTKNQVLEELPPRTEVTLNVEMSPEETAFYETLRRKAIEQIESLDVPVEQKRFRILAEIMRLRRACCNSRLVLPDSPIESSKLTLFWEVVEELLENRHKALVFSQFVDHLAIMRTLLDEKRVAYQYLDGSTPARERQRRVDAFQSGAGDLFLISLKAGGMGINLTAADYVIHMDPWWNPAVEDQASDRIHRIGQLRPVTIYRLVTRGTIEEKIVELHRHKRDLADGLLEDADMSGKLSMEELLRMIHGQT
ncbi:MAG: ATP-dependent helicase [Magnetococcales bacterium]|nr:ATP-dependent helicase [Magnetococcales bacterium]